MSGKYDNIGAIRKVALGGGTALAIFFLLAFVPKLISVFEGSSPPPRPGTEWEGDVMLATFAAYMIGYAIGWWRRLWGGVVILLAALIVSVPFIVIQGHFNSLIFGVPILVVGVLYLVLHREESRKQS